MPVDHTSGFIQQLRHRAAVDKKLPAGATQPAIVLKLTARACIGSGEFGNIGFKLLKAAIKLFYLQSLVVVA